VLLPGLVVLLLVGLADRFAPWALLLAAGLAVAAAVVWRWKRWRRERREDAADLAEGLAFAARARTSSAPADLTTLPPAAGQSARRAGRAS